MQLILTFIILSVITLVAILLIVLNKNSRSAKLQQIAQNHNWHYQEFIDFDDSIKNANFGLITAKTQFLDILFRQIVSTRICPLRRLIAELLNRLAFTIVRSSCSI